MTKCKRDIQKQVKFPLAVREKKKKNVPTDWLSKGADHCANIKSLNGGLQQADPAWELACLEYQMGPTQKLLTSFQVV